MVVFLKDGCVLVVAAFLLLIHNSCQPHGSVMHPMTVSFPQVSLGNICSELVKLDVFVMVILLQAGCWIWATAEEAELVWS